MKETDFLKISEHFSNLREEEAILECQIIDLWLLQVSNNSIENVQKQQRGEVFT